MISRRGRMVDAAVAGVLGWLFPVFDGMDRKFRRAGQAAGRDLSIFPLEKTYAPSPGHDHSVPDFNLNSGIQPQAGFVKPQRHRGKGEHRGSLSGIF